MKLLDIILLVLAFCTLIIGIDQAVVLGMAKSYWIFMFSLTLLLLYRYRKVQRQAISKTDQKISVSQKKKK